jgi:NAD(P)-dependent dehydrogenase (short-subunit alcohol dehydrogenase family)
MKGSAAYQPEAEGDAKEPQVIVVTGASAGVGRATARAFAERGQRVALLARGRAGLEGTAEDVRLAGGTPLVVPVDVADPERIEQAAERIEAELGAIDIWVNNAMTTVFAPVAEITADEFRRTTEVTYLGAVWGTMAALRRMRARGSGVIVQVGSALAYRAIPLQAPYCGAKHALRGFTDALRCELLHEGSRVRITMVHLPALNTPQFSWCRTKLPNHPQPVPPIFQPEVAARAIVWAAQNPRRELWVGWPTIKAIAGNKIAPGLIDRYLARTGYESQQTSDPVPPDRRDDLFIPVDEERDFGARGVFDRRSRDSSLIVTATLHRGWLLAGAALVTGATVFMLSRKFGS